jgi:hypothetical protein
VDDPSEKWVQRNRASWAGFRAILCGDQHAAKAWARLRCTRPKCSRLRARVWSASHFAYTSLSSAGFVCSARWPRALSPGCWTTKGSRVGLGPLPQLIPPSLRSVQSPGQVSLPGFSHETAAESFGPDSCLDYAFVLLRGPTLRSRRLHLRHSVCGLSDKTNSVNYPRIMCTGFRARIMPVWNRVRCHQNQICGHWFGTCTYDVCWSSGFRFDLVRRPLFRVICRVHLPTHNAQEMARFGQGEGKSLFRRVWSMFCCEMLKSVKICWNWLESRTLQLLVKLKRK